MNITVRLMPVVRKRKENKTSLDKKINNGGITNGKRAVQSGNGI
jgi:hypothetical protein